MRFPRLLLILALPVLLAACGGTAPPPAGELSTGAVASHLSRLVGAVAPGDSLAAARRTLYAADRLRQSGLQPAFPPSFLLAQGAAPEGVNPAAAHVLGYVAGRNPRYAPELVLLTADLDSPAGAALLETARRLAADARDAIRPEATVGVLLLGPPHTGLAGVESFLRRPPWALEGISRVLVVASDTARARVEVERWAGEGLVAEAIALPAPERDLPAATWLARAAYARAHDAAARSFAPAQPLDITAIP
jgi:hypothetical protein